MASCEYKPAVYPNPKPITPAKYVLSLSRKEAAVLKIILMNVGGDQASTLRIYSDSINIALPNYAECSIELFNCRNNSMFFAEGSEHSSLFKSILENF